MSRILAEAVKPLVLTTLEPRTVRVNKEFTRMFDYTPEEVVARRLRDFIAPGELSPEALTDVPALIEGRRVEQEVIRQRKDGSRFHAHITSARVPLPSETTTAFMIYRDISARKATEALIKGENRVLEMIARGSPLTAILDLLCPLIEESFFGCRALILLIDAHGRMHRGAAPNLLEDYSAAFDGCAIGPSSGACGIAAYRRKAVIVPDIETHPESEQYRITAAALGLRSCWSMPVFSSEDKVLGAFAIFHREPRSPNAQEMSTIDRVSHLVSIAIERTEARLELENGVWM